MLMEDTTDLFFSHQILWGIAEQVISASARLFCKKAAQTR